MQRLEIVIDELVLRGVPPERAHETAAAIEARLTALGERWAQSPAALAPRSEANRRVAAAAPHARGLGAAVGGAVWGAIARGGRG
jgi:alpha-D-ribose 1-methylphosphonate 5-triphosphate synthase subunit PhnL